MFSETQAQPIKKLRKTATSSAVKNRWNKKHYKSFSTQVKPELADRIAAYREKEGLSTSQFLTRAMDVLEAINGNKEG